MKRKFDIIVSLIVLLITSPIFVMVYISMMGKQVVYRQERIGKYGEPFILWKFRTMKIGSHPRKQCLEGDDRITNIGKFLRGTHIDELPQLFNVVKGDMSLVGPRPLLRYELLSDGREIDLTKIKGFKERCEVLPGIAGYAQLALSATAPIEDKFTCDIEYIRNQSFFGDIKLICLQVIKTLKRIV